MGASFHIMSLADLISVDALLLRFKAGTELKCSFIGNLNLLCTVRPFFNNIAAMPVHATGITSKPESKHFCISH